MHVDDSSVEAEIS